MLKLLNFRPQSLGLCHRTLATSIETDKQTIDLQNKSFVIDSYTNCTPKILSHLGRNLHCQKNHPLSIVRQRIVNYFYNAFLSPRGNPLFSVHDNLTPIVTVQQNFDNLLIPANHPSRAKSDCYYLNKEYLLRAHTTAHQVDLIRSGLDNFLVTGDVYRRDEIDATHYPVFHQLDAVRIVQKDKLFQNNPDLEIFENSYKTRPDSFDQPAAGDTGKCLDQSKQPCHTLEAVKLMEHDFKQTLVGLIKQLFGDKIQYRWVDAYFPFTQPSWELEILHKGEWIEVLGAGIMRNEILENAGVGTNSIGYAFGLGLERLAMILFDIPDIRLFWSTDSGFLNQFDEKQLKKSVKYKPISVFPQCHNDLSFWLADGVGHEEFVANDLFDTVRDIGGDIIEQVKLIDQFRHPKSGKCSLCYRITYRHMERTLTQAEVNDMHAKIGKEVANLFNVVIR